MKKVLSTLITLLLFFGLFATSASAKTIKPVYYIYNHLNGDALYTMDKNEADFLVGDVEYIVRTGRANPNLPWGAGGIPGWDFVRIEWYGADEGEPIYRLYCPINGKHLYTMDSNEINVLVNQHGWALENNGNPVLYSNGPTPIYRFYDTTFQLHHYTAEPQKYINMPTRTWNQEGIKFYGYSQPN